MAGRRIRITEAKRERGSNSYTGGQERVSLRLSDTDLDFVVQQAAPEFEDKAKLKQLMREDESFRKGLVGDERVFRKAMVEEEIILRISPPLYFEILLRKALNELEKASHTIERAGTEIIAVFDAGEVVGFLSRQAVLDYLINMLSSFTRVESYVISLRARKGIWRKIKFNDMDIDALTRLCETMDEEHRFSFYQRIADVCLFILGIFPEHARFDYHYPFWGEVRPRIAKAMRRGEEDYEAEGKKYYKLAAEHQAAIALGLSDVFWLLHQNFNIARKPLNFIAEHYLHFRKHKLFGM
jgi:hypothetical protein